VDDPGFTIEAGQQVLTTPDNELEPTILARIGEYARTSIARSNSFATSAMEQVDNFTQNSPRIKDLESKTCTILDTISDKIDAGIKAAT
jgi:hypothetical protein